MKSLIRWIRMWPLRRRCFHHYIPTVGDQRTAVESWIRSELIDLGRHKMWWCSNCGKVWIS